MYITLLDNKALNERVSFLFVGEKPVPLDRGQVLDLHLGETQVLDLHP